MSEPKYFTQYAEQEIQLLANFPLRYYKHVLCIPAFDETVSFLEHINSCAKNTGRLLFILVVNQSEDSSPCENNEKLVSHIKKYSTLWQSSGNIQLIDAKYYDILLIDRYTEKRQIPKKNGVGLARKIACDCAAYLIFKGIIQSHQIFCSDADVIFPANYFSALLDKKYSASTFNFTHTKSDNESINNATQLYEKSLHHYVNGLQQANSQYAFHTIGSCLLINSDFYIKARGFPTRPAGEDFYLLNKLQKLAPVTNINNITLNIESRLSTRVPFGTGPAVDKLINSNNEAIFYHPECFRILACWLNYLDGLSEDNGFTLPPISNDAHYIHELAELFNTQENTNKLFANHKTASARKIQLHQWFDAFKTLKAIHYLRDRYFASISYKTLTHLHNEVI
jgi:hypothetical protein